jgi:hypothetical protein
MNQPFAASPVTRSGNPELNFDQLVDGERIGSVFLSGERRYHL